MSPSVTNCKTLVYLAGPYTRPDPVLNVHNTCKVADRVLEMGLIPFIPHLTHTYHLVSPKPVDFWYEYDIHMMRRCDLVMRIPGESTGADREVAAAKAAGIPVVKGLEGLDAWRMGKATKRLRKLTEADCDGIIREFRRATGQ